jgi:hypothetical protein
MSVDHMHLHIIVFRGDIDCGITKLSGLIILTQYREGLSNDPSRPTVNLTVK